MKVLICDYPEPMNRDLRVEDRFLRAGLGEELSVTHWVYNGRENDLLGHLRGADALLTAYLELPARVLDRAGKLRFISIEATGYNLVDADAAARNGIGVAVIGEYCTEEVADHTLALALAVSRRLKTYARSTERDRRFDFAAAEPMFRFSGAVWGVLGYGRIGRAVARRARGFGMRVIAWDRRFPPAEAARQGVELLPRDEVLAQSRILSLHTLLVPETVHLLDDAAFAKMENRPVVVNVSRGGLIDEAALLRALDSRRVFGAGLDVLDCESHAAMQTNPLVGREDVVLTPHAAFYSAEAMEACARISCRNIAAYFTGRRQEVFRMVNRPQEPAAGTARAVSSQTKGSASA